MPEQSLSKKKVFIIYGQDLEAYRHLVKFIGALGLEELAFHNTSKQLGPNPFIADIVTKSIGKADVVIALFTPDEHAALYGKEHVSDPIGSERYLLDVRGGSRWQARPNVIFEAGVAYGTKPGKTILVTIGTDVELFSDMGGKHFVQLAEHNGKQKLRDKLETVLGPLLPTQANWEDPEVSGDFHSCLRIRWEFYDEIGRLETVLRSRDVKNHQLLDVIAKVVWQNPQRNWKVSEEEDFIKAIIDQFGWEVGNLSYWWLVVYGFFQFKGIEFWYEEGADEEPNWEDSIGRVRWTDRALALIEICRAKPKPPEQILYVFNPSRSVGEMPIIQSSTKKASAGRKRKSMKGELNKPNED